MKTQYKVIPWIILLTLIFTNPLTMGYEQEICKQAASCPTVCNRCSDVANYCQCRTCCEGNVQGEANCDYGVECPTRYADLDTDQMVYKTGDKVGVILSNPRQCDFRFNKVYIQQMTSKTDSRPVVHTVYRHPNPQSLSSPYSWNWNQTDSSGNSVCPGRYMVVIETFCGETYRSLFRIVPVCQPQCPSEECCCVCCTDDP